MRLHYSRTVLAAVVWTILLNGSAESIDTDPTGRRTLARWNNEREKGASAWGEQIGNAAIDGDRSKAGSVSPVAAASARIIMENAVEATGKSEPVLSVNTSPSFSQKPEETNGIRLKPEGLLKPEGDRDYYDNDEPGIQASIAANPNNPTPSGANTTVSRGTNEGTNRSQPSVSMAPKADKTRTPNGKTNHRATSKGSIEELFTPGEKLEDEKRARKSAAGYESFDATLRHLGEDGDNFPSHSPISSTSSADPSASSSIDDSTDSGFSFRQVVRSLTSIRDRRFSTKAAGRSIAALSREEIDPGNQGKEENEENDAGNIATLQDAVIGQAEENSGTDESGGNMRKADSPDGMSGADKSDLRPAEKRNPDVASTLRKRQRGSPDLQGQKSYVAKLSENERKIAPSGPPDFHTILVEEPRGLSEGPPAKTAEPRDTNTPSFPVNRPSMDPAKSLIRNYLERPSGARKSGKNSFSRAVETGNPVKINNPERAKSKRDFYSSAGESGVTNGKRTADKNKAAGNEVLEAGNFSAARNKLAGARGRRGVRVPGPGGPVDNAVNPDSRPRDGIHGSVVTDALTGWQMKNRDHKILITRVAAAGGINRRRRSGEPGKQEQRVFAVMDPPGSDGFAIQARGARMLQSAEKSSKGFSSTVEAVEAVDVLNSLSGTTERAGRTTFSADDLEDTGRFRNVAVGGIGLVTSGTREATRSPGTVEDVVNDIGYTDDTRGVKVTAESPRKSFGKVDRPTSRFPSMVAAPDDVLNSFSGTTERASRTTFSGDDLEDTGRFRNVAVGGIGLVTSGTKEATRSPGSPELPESVEDVVNDTGYTDDTRDVKVTEKSFKKVDRPTARFSSMVEAPNDVWNSLSGTTEGAGRSTFSADDLEDTGRFRNVAVGGIGLVTSGTREATRSPGSPELPESVEDVVNDTNYGGDTRGVKVTDESPGKSFGKIDRPTSTDATRPTVAAFPELRPRDPNPGDHRDCQKSTCDDRSKMELSASRREGAGPFLVITASTEEVAKPPRPTGHPDSLEQVVNDADDTRGAKVTAEKATSPFGSKIDRPIPTDAPRSTGTVFPELRPGDTKSGERRDGEESECSDRGKTTKSPEPSGENAAAFSRRVKNASGSRVDLGDQREVGGDVVTVAVSPDGQRKRKRWKGGTANAKPAAVDPFVAVLLKGRNDEITNVTRADSLDGKKRKKENDEFFRRAKINDASGTRTANRSGLRDATAAVDAPETRGEPGSHIAGETFDVAPCETWKTAAIAGNERDEFDGENRESGGEIGAGGIDPPTGVFRAPKVTTRGGVTRGNGISAVPATSNNRAGSLGRHGAEFKSIDRRGPEAREPRRMRRTKGDRLVRGQKAIFIKPEGANLILPGERVAHQPASVGKLDAPDVAELRLPVENLGNDWMSLKGNAASDPGKGVGGNEKQKQKQEHDSSITGFTANFAGTSDPRARAELSDAGTNDPGDHENFGAPSTSQTRSSSGRPGRRRKSVVDKSSTSSTKTDSVEPAIDGPEYREGPATGAADQPHSQPGVSDANNGSVGQIKGGFTTLESAVTAGALRSSNGSWMPDAGDVKSTGAIMRTTGDVVTVIEPSGILPATETNVGSIGSFGTLPRGAASTPVVELSSENPVALNAVNPDPAFVESMERIKASMAGTGGGPANLQQTKQTSENDGIMMGGPRHFNYSASDNSTRAAATSNQWPVKYSAVVEGDLVLGGLMMVHEREDSVTCGPVMPQGGVQALEAMLYTLDWVSKRDLVPGVKIGAHILDDCDKDTYGLEMAVDFIKGSISNIDGAEYHCNKTAVRKVISGVVGAASSVTSIQVANLLRLFRIPQVSFFSTSPELSNKMRFEYFTRTIPSDHYQVKAMVDIVRLMGWSYVSIIYEESNYGEKAYEELEKLLGKHQICIAVKEKLSKDSGVAKAHVYDNIVLKLLTKPRARGCIIFASDQEVAGVMKAVRRCNATGAFSWIGSDGWSARSLVSDGNEPEMEGTLSVQPQANPVEGFEDYFLNLTVENNRRNPWFVEFWEDHFKCRYPNASHTPYNNYTEECTTTEKLTKQNTAFENQLQFVSDAVMAFAYAFRNMHADLCHGVRGLCDAMKPTKGTELLSYLRTVQFKGLSGDVFHFDKNGDGPARYNIIHFKQVSPGKYKWIRVGKYLEGELRLNMSEIQFRLGHPEPPESVCSLPCEVGQAKKYVEGESCCWHCFNCTQYQIRNDSDERQCVLCPKGTVPDETHSYCRDIPENFLRPESGWAIGAMSFSSTGILITLCVGGVFLKHNDTPIVRASGRELSYVLLTGILLCYLVTFALVLRPNDLVCSIQRFSAGFCFTVVYAALLTKTNRISRIFNAGKHSAKRPSFISPRSQLIICSMLVGVQILINGVWMVIDPAKAIHHYPTREDNLLVCNSYIDASYMIAFTYPIILIVVCTVYAVLTRKIPEAFNESKHIGFTMYTTCVIWLAFVPLYFGTGSQVALKITSMSVTISLSASVTIACLFTPKLYIILIHPERNVRPNMMMNRYNTTKGSVVTATNASSMMAPVTLTAVTCDQNKAVKKHIITTMDCSTQSEQYEMETKDHKNGKLPPAVITRSTQTLLNNNGTESGTVTSPVIKDIGVDENLPAVKSLNLAKIGNGPLSQTDVSL